MTPRRITIIGAGPIGLEAALYGRTLGHDVVVYERGDVADNVRQWAFVRLFSPWAMNATPLGWKALADRGPRSEAPDPQQCPTADEFRERYVLPIADLLGGAIRTHTSVITIGKGDYLKSDAIGKPDRARSPFRLLVRDRDGRERTESADVVLDCSGTYGRHRWAGRGGIPAPLERALADAGRIRYTIPDVLGRDRDRYAGRHTLVIGCGHSAATVLCDLGRLAREHPRTRVTWATRRAGQALQPIDDDPLPARAELVNASMKLAEAPPPWLRYIGSGVLDRVDSIAPDLIGVTLATGAANVALRVNQIVALVGYAPDASLYDQLQVHQCYATAGPIKLAAALLGESGQDCLMAGSALGPDTLRNPEPGFYILGAKSFGTNSNFLLKVGHQQVRDAYQLIEGDAQLDLYEPKTRASHVGPSGSSARIGHP